MSLLIALASMVGADTARIQAAVLIRDNSSSFLQLDIERLLGCQVPVIDSVAAHQHSVAGSLAQELAVSWHLATSTAAACSSAIRANVLYPLSGSDAVATADAVLDNREGVYRGEVALGHVQNLLVPVCPMYVLAPPDSATAFKYASQQIQAHNLVAIYDSVSIAPFPWMSTSGGWRQATGLESFVEVTSPLPGNVGNWINVDIRTLRESRLFRGVLPPNCCTGIICCDTLIDIPTFSVPIGPIQYFYQQPTIPTQGDTTADIAEFVVDSTLKVGRHLHLSGVISQSCYTPHIDQELVQSPAWLVASNGYGTDPLIAAFNWAQHGYSHASAWPVRDNSVRIGPRSYSDTAGIWVPLAELLQDSGTDVSTKSGAATAPHLLRIGDATVLRLSAPAQVQVHDLQGHVAVRPMLLSAGVHVLELPVGASSLYVQVRAGGATTILPLQRLR